MKKIILFLIAFTTFNSAAGSLVCEGTVESVAYHSNNRLMVRLSSMNTPVFFCSTNTDWVAPGAEGKIMSPESCQVIFSVFLTAKTTREPISRVHFDGDDVPDTCDSFESWKHVFIRYVNF